jgi:S-adenosylhomocysteine hydrolase
MANINMPLLSEIVEQFKNTIDFDNCLFLCVQHLMLTNIDLFSSLIRLHAKPSNIYVMGKRYSANKKAIDILKNMNINVMPMHKQNESTIPYKNALCDDIDEMINSLLKTNKINTYKNIFILDDGGYFLSRYSKVNELYHSRVIGIEQTSSGLNLVQNTNFPIIEVASSALKQQVESIMIARTIYEKSPQLFRDTNKKFSVIGLGVIGRAMVDLFNQLGIIPFVYDNNNLKYKDISHVNIVKSCDEAFHCGDLIFGCTGNDLTLDMSKESICLNNKTLISCSSADVEFRSLLKYGGHGKDTPLSDVVIQQSNGALIRIINGGFPVNLNRAGSSVKACDIQLTRALLLAGLIQAYFVNQANNSPKRIMLDPSFQQMILKQWIRYGSNYVTKHPIIKNLLETNNITTLSGGTRVPLARFNIMTMEQSLIE